MPDHTEYETGARHPVEKTQRQRELLPGRCGEQKAALRPRNSESKQDINEKTRHSDGQNRVSSVGED